MEHFREFAKRSMGIMPQMWILPVYSIKKWVNALNRV